MTILSVLGRNIAEERKKLGMNQRELAHELGITQDALSRIEKGKMAPKMSRLEDFATVFKCPISRLFLTEAEKQHNHDLLITECMSKLPPVGRAALFDLVKHAVDVMMANFSASKDVEK